MAARSVRPRLPTPLRDLAAWTEEGNGTRKQRIALKNGPDTVAGRGLVTAQIDNLAACCNATSIFRSRSCRSELPERDVQSGVEVSFFGIQYVVPTVVEWPRTIIAVNVGGAVIPGLLSLFCSRTGCGSAG
jgi:hypothetical protein